MGFRSTLNLGGQAYDVLDCNYSLKGDVDSKNSLSFNIYGGRNVKGMDLDSHSIFIG